MAEAKQKKEIYFLVALAAVAVLVWYFEFAKQPAASGFSVDNSTYTPINAQDFGGVLKGLETAQGTEYKSTGRNIFVMGALPAPVTGDANATKQVVASSYHNKGPHLPPPPPPAQLSMKFFGYGNLPSGGPRQAFLLDGEDVHIVSEGDTLQNHIRILKIGNESIEFEDINTHQRGSNPIEASPTTPAA
jgi:hypothetical protein